MEEKNNLPALRGIPPDKITKQNIIALFNTETVRWNYNKMLQGLKGMVITKDTLQKEYPEFKEADKFVKAITEWRKQQAKPFNDVDALFLEVSKEIIEPILEATNSLKVQVRSASEANAAEIAQAKREQDKKNLIVKTIGEFINKVTTDITLATTDAQIVSIQKKIGSEKARTGFYEGFIEELRTKCDALNTVINNQKEKIRELDKLKTQFDNAVNGNDDQKASELKEKIEETNAELVENSIRLQEKAFEQSLGITNIEVGQPDVNVVSGKSNRWRWKVDDVGFLHKKYPQFTKIVTNDEAIEAFMKEQREAGLFKTEELEVKVNGITFFKQKYL